MRGGDAMQPLLDSTPRRPPAIAPGTLLSRSRRPPPAGFIRLACLPPPSARRAAPAGFTRSSTTASG